jgi:hypothetical protein
VNFDRVIEHDHRVYQKPEEPLLALWLERSQSPKSLAAEPLDGALVGVLGLVARQPVLGLIDPLDQPSLAVLELVEASLHSRDFEIRCQVQVQQLPFLALRL